MSDRSTSHFTALRVGTRSSRLAITQTGNALDRVRALLPGVHLEMCPLSSPGDEDRVTDLRESAPDFFTRYLDDAVRAGEIDCAVHSAKDLPDPVSADLDWFWLPWREDPRDCLIFRPGETAADLPDAPVLAVSSERRAEYCTSRFPKGVHKPVRGNIEERLEQLDAGEFDVMVMAVAALNRLGIASRISEMVTLEELPSPDGQGYLAVTYLAGDRRMAALRSLFVRAAALVGAGPGDPELCTVGGRTALARCDLCLYDALAPHALLSALPPGARAVDVGKRRGQYAVPRQELERLMVDGVRRGQRVVRLKGGDAGVFGRLAEEVSALMAAELPFRVLAGVSSMAAASTGTGLMLTRRGVAHGFSVLTPRLANGIVQAIEADVRERLPLVLYMAVDEASTIADLLIKEGRAADEPAAMVYNASHPDETRIHGTLATIGDAVAAHQTRAPGVLLVGATAAADYVYPVTAGALAGRRVLVTSSAELQAEAADLVRDFGGVPIGLPLISLTPETAALSVLETLADYRWVVLSSPAAVRALMQLLADGAIDLRTVPDILSCGPGVDRVLAEYGLRPAVTPSTAFGTEGLLAAARERIAAGDRVLRLRSDVAGPQLADGLAAAGAAVEDCVLYCNVGCASGTLPAAEAAVFASGSAVRSFVEAWGAESLAPLVTAAIGQPTAAALAAAGAPAAVVASESTIAGTVTSLAAHCVELRLAALAKEEGQ
jgi:uroporphyrinogen III methyltransferase/synthase